MPYQNNTDLIEQPKIQDYVPSQDLNNVRREIINGLCSENKSIPSKFFYDSKGSALFERITRQEEYYPTRTEKSIIKAYADSVFRQAKPDSITELGSGDPSKISIVLSHLQQNRQADVRYQPVDISKSAVEESLDILKSRFPSILSKGIIMDFTNQLELLQPAEKELFCFFGSTLGNFPRELAVQFLKDIRSIMKPANHLLLGLDLVKNREVLEKAYNDASGVTEAFNLNILSHINRILQSDFRKEDFNHLAFYNDQEERIEMHLEARQDMMIDSPLFEQALSIQKGERILTEYSHKYSPQRIDKILRQSSFLLKDSYTDENSFFRLLLLTPEY
jgi:L-histidine N-alpha-methyltransferase